MLFTALSKSLVKQVFKKSLITLRNSANNFFSTKMSKTALVLIANGTEELEFVSIVDVLRRGDVAVTVAGVPDAEAKKCRSDIVILPEKSLNDVEGSYDALVLPGGLGGSNTFCQSTDVGSFLVDQLESGRVLALICAAPLALKAHSVGHGRRITSYPAMAADLKKDDLYKYETDSPVVVDGNLITSKGPATALLFSLTILEHLQGKDKARQVASAMLFEYN